MVNRASSELIEKWLKGWSLSRELPLPVQFQSGYKVEVGFEKQKTRYVFPEPNADFIQLSESVDEPWIWLKVCASPEEIKHIIPEKWVVQPQGYMMTCFHPMNFTDNNLPAGYTFEFDYSNATFIVRIVTQYGELASIGRVVLVDDLAVYDRISTESNHRRKGLATVLMKELEKLALSKGIYKNFLVATDEGKTLYQSLGWEVYCLYTAVVIAS